MFFVNSSFPFCFPLNFNSIFTIKIHFHANCWQSLQNIEQNFFPSAYCSGLYIILNTWHLDAQDLWLINNEKAYSKCDQTSVDIKHLNVPFVATSGLPVNEIVNQSLRFFYSNFFPLEFQKNVWKNLIHSGFFSSTWLQNVLNGYFSSSVCSMKICLIPLTGNRLSQ